MQVHFSMIQNTVNETGAVWRRYVSIEVTRKPIKALRHATMRLGEMLHDIGNMSIMGDRANPSLRNVVEEK